MQPNAMYVSDAFPKIVKTESAYCMVFPTFYVIY